MPVEFFMIKTFQNPKPRLICKLFIISSTAPFLFGRMSSPARSMSSSVADMHGHRLLYGWHLWILHITSGSIQTYFFATNHFQDILCTKRLIDIWHQTPLQNRKTRIPPLVDRHIFISAQEVCVQITDGAAILSCSTVTTACTAATVETSTL